MRTFRVSNHQYFLDDVRLPGVTTILRHGIGLVPVGVPQHVLDKAADRGIKVHAATAAYDMGTLDTSSCDPMIMEYVDQWAKFINDTGAQIAGVERANYHELLRYAGTYDRLVVIKEKKYIVDIKCVAKVSHATALQLAAYAMMEGDNVGRICVWLRADHNYKAIYYTDPMDYTLFCSALTIYKWKERNGITEFSETDSAIEGEASEVDE